MIRWLGGEAEALRAKRWRYSTRATTILLYALALAGCVIVYLGLLVACKPAEPVDNRPPAVVPSQPHFAEVDEQQYDPEVLSRCGIRPEDPRSLP